MDFFKSKTNSYAMIIGEGVSVEINTLEVADGQSLRVEGKLIGPVGIKGNLEIGEKGIVDGTIICKDLLVAGSINAGILIEAVNITILAGANVKGSIRYLETLSIENGAHIEGHISKIRSKAEEEVIVQELDDEHSDIEIV